ncbi:MAG: hypothetical protein M3P51_18525 [Chloroflexota bacterium]|nr:hypothetical protein [Chloroflexota bacterium]
MGDPSLGYGSPIIERWIHTPALPLVSDRQMLHDNMRRELITEGELMS